MQKNIFWIFLFVFIDVLGFSLVLPLLPFYAKEFNTSPSVVGLMLTFNALTQMISAPFLGRLSDHFGRKPLLLLCIAGTVVGFLILGSADSVFLLFFSRIIDGLLGGNISLAQAYISDVTNDGERSSGFGVVGAAFGIGFIIGPAIGGTLSAYGYKVPAYTAALIALINFVGVLFFLPESLPKEKRRKSFFSNPTSDTTNSSSSPKKRESYFEIFHIIFQVHQLFQWIVLRFFYLFIFTLFETCFGFFNFQKLSLNARQSSYLLVYIGILYSFVQGGGIRLFTGRKKKKVEKKDDNKTNGHSDSLSSQNQNEETKAQQEKEKEEEEEKKIHLKEKKLVLYSFFILSLSLFFWSFVSSLRSALVVLFPLSLTCGILNTLINSEISKKAEQSHLGELLGVSAAVGSLSRILAPMVGGYLIEYIDIKAPGFFGAFICGAMVFFISREKLASVPVAEKKIN